MVPNGVKQGEARRGEARRGEARRGEERRGKVRHSKTANTRGSRVVCWHSDMDPDLVAACEDAARDVLTCQESPDGETSCDRVEEAASSLHLVNTAISCILCVTGIALNGLLAYTIASDIRFRTPVNAVVVALAATNLLLLTAMVPFTIDHFSGWYVLCAVESMTFLIAKETVLVCFTAVAVLRFVQVVLGVKLSNSWRSLLLAGAVPLLLAYALVAAIWGLEPYQCQALDLSGPFGRALFCLKPPRIPRIMPLLVGSDAIGIVITAFCYGAVLWKVLLRRGDGGGCLGCVSQPMLPRRRNAGNHTEARRPATLELSATTPNGYVSGGAMENCFDNRNVGGGTSECGVGSSQQDSTLAPLQENSRSVKRAGQTRTRTSESAIVGRRSARSSLGGAMKSTASKKPLPKIAELIELDEVHASEESNSGAGVTAVEETVAATAEGKTDEAAEGAAEEKAVETAEGKAAEMAEGKAAETAMGKAAETAEGKAAETADGNASEMADGKAAETAEGKAAEMAEGKAAETVEGKAAETAEGKAAETAEGKAAETAEGKAAETVEGKTAETAEGKAAETAEGKAAETAEGKAAETAEGKATETAEEKAAETAEGKAAETAEGKAAETAAGKAAETAAGTAETTTKGKTGETAGGMAKDAPAMTVASSPRAPPAPVAIVPVRRPAGGPAVMPLPAGGRLQSRMDVVTWISSCSHLAAMLLGLIGPALVGLSLDQQPQPFLTSSDVDRFFFSVITTSAGITHLLPFVLVVFCTSLREAIAKNVKRMCSALSGCFY